IAGANFWPWILLNVVIAIVVSSREYQQPSWVAGIAMAAFILVSPWLANVAFLGWYDSGANNKRFFLAEDSDGNRHYVSSNFFSFYSYPISHWDYGVPEPERAFATGMNGGVNDIERARAGRECNLSIL